MTRSDVGKGHPAYYQDLAAADRAETRRRVLRQPIRQSGEPAGARADHRARDLGADGPRRRRRRVRRRLAAERSPGYALLPRHRAAEVEMILADPQGSILAEYARSGQPAPAGSWLVEGIGEDFVPPISDLSVAARPTASTTGKLRCRAASCFASRAFSGVVDRHVARCGTALLPQPHRARARGHLRLRHRHEVPVQDVQRLLDGGPRPHRPRDGTATFRPRRPPLRRGRRGHDRSGRHAADCAWAVQALQCLAAAGHRQWKIVGIIDESDVLLAVVRDGERSPLRCRA